MQRPEGPVLYNLGVRGDGLERLAARAMMGLARTGSSASNGSGDYAIAFSTAESVRRPHDAPRLTVTELANEQMSALFQAVVESVEEAIYNSLFAATTVTATTGPAPAAVFSRPHTRTMDRERWIGLKMGEHGL